MPALAQQALELVEEDVATRLADVDERDRPRLAARRQRALGAASRSAVGSRIVRAMAGCSASPAPSLSRPRPSLRRPSRTGRRRRRRRRAGCGPRQANFATGMSGSLTHCASMPSGEPPAPRTSEPAGACVSSCRRSWTWARLQPASLKIRPCSGPTSSIASNARRRRGVATFSSAIASDAHSPSGSRASWSTITRGASSAITVTPGLAGGDAAVLREPGPRRGVVEALGEAHAELAGLAVGRAVLDAGTAAADVAHDELQRAPGRHRGAVALAEHVDAGCGSRGGRTRRSPGRPGAWWRAARASRTSRRRPLRPRRARPAAPGPSQPAITALTATFSTVASPP